MDEPNDTAGGQPAWVGDKAPCVYCGQVIPRDSDRCPQCRTSFSLAVRKASREVVGAWSYLDPRNPSGRGVTFETLVKMIEKGRVRPTSIVRGPTTHQDWMYAAEAPRLAKYLGMCPHCFAEAKPEDVYCSRCQLNMNTRPAEARPGIPADLVKAPVHTAAYQIEKQLTDTVMPAEQDLMVDMESPVAAPVARAEPVRAEPARSEGGMPDLVRAEVVGAGRADSLRKDLTPSPSRAALAAAAAAEMTPHTPHTPMAVERQSRVASALQKQKNPKVWVIEVLTLATLVPLFILLGYTDVPLRISKDAGFVGGINSLRSILPGSSYLEAPDKPSLQAEPGAADVWLSQQLGEANKADQDKDYERAIRIYQGIVAKSTEGDRKAWEARIQGLKKKLDDQRMARFVQLKDRLDSAEKLQQDRKYDDALAVLKNLSASDREVLLAAKFDVADMEASIRASQAKAMQEKKQEDQLVLQFKQADMLKGTPAAARDEYRKIASTYPAAMVRKYVDIDKKIKDLDAQIAAAKVAPPVATPTPAVAPAMTAEEAQRKMAVALAEVTALEKAEKFGPAIDKLEAIKTKYPEAYWPKDLDKRIDQNKSKKSALDFFGVEPTKKATPTKAP